MTAAGAASRYPIRAVSRLTGIGIDTIRAWERRYGAVVPTRDRRGRLYTSADVERLRLLQRAVAAGHRVGRAAALTDDDLRHLSAAETALPRPSSGLTPGAPVLDTGRLEAALERLDGSAVDEEFLRLAMALPPQVLVRDVLLPMLRSVGDRWNSAPGAIAREHLISTTVRSLLGTFLRLYGRRSSPVRMLFATPQGDRHELGILCAALLAASQGLSVTYLGPDLPVNEIASAVQASGSQVLVLGVTMRDVRDRSRTLTTLARRVPRGVEIWLGGPGVPAAADTPARITILADLDAYLDQLTRIVHTPAAHVPA